MITNIDEALSIPEIRLDILQKFEARLQPLYYPPNPLITMDTWCILCSGPSNADGYKIFNASNVELRYEISSKTHIVSYILYIGPRQDLQVQHNCGVRYCANYHHLTLGRNKKNGTHASKTKASPSPSNKSWKLSEPQKIKIRDLRFSHNYPIDVLMQMYGVSKQTIYKTLYERISYEEIDKIS